MSRVKHNITLARHMSKRRKLGMLTAQANKNPNRINTGNVDVYFIESLDMNNDEKNMMNDELKKLGDMNIIRYCANETHRILDQEMRDEITKLDRSLLNESECTMNTLRYMLSHFDIIKKCASNNRHCLILDGYFSICTNFQNRFIKHINDVVPESFDICYLSFNTSDYENGINHIKHTSHLLVKSGIYLMTPSYAQKLVSSFSNHFNIYHQFDSMINDIHNQLKGNIYIMKPYLIHVHDTALITAGIGDFLVMDFFYDLSRYKYIYIISPQAENIADLIKTFKNYKHSKIITFNCKTQLNVGCYFSLEEIMWDAKFPINIKHNLKSANDYSIFKKFPEIRDKIRRNHKVMINQCNLCRTADFFSSSVLTNTLCDISHLSLPEKFYFICSDSTCKLIHCTTCKVFHDEICPKTLNKRDYLDIDWETTIKILEQNKIQGVVTGIYDIPPKYASHPSIIDLSKKTNIMESFEILKKASGYVGIDTCFTVISSKLFNINYIKSINIHLFLWDDIYYYTNKNRVIAKDNINM